MTGLLQTLLDLQISDKVKMAAIAGSGDKITFISACIHDSKRNSSGYSSVYGAGQHDWTTAETVQYLSCQKSKMAAITRKLVGNNAYVSLCTQ